MQFSTKGIKVQLFVIALAFSIGLVVVGTIGIISSSNLGRDLDTAVNESMPMVRSLTLIDMAHDGIRGMALEAVLGATQNDKKRVASAKEGISEHEKKVTEEFKTVTKNVHDGELGKLVKQATDDMKIYLEAAHRLADVADTGDAAKTLSGFDAFQEQFEALEKSLGSLGEFSEKVITEQSAEALKGAGRARNLSLICFALALGMGLMAALASKDLAGAHQRLGRGRREF
jgi:methyl-accepting chemotaxis protein